MDARSALSTGAGIPHGAELVGFAASAHLRATDLAAKRTALIAAVGEAGLVEAALTVSAFNGLTRVADATGIQLDGGTMAATADVRQELAINTFAGAANTPVASAVSGAGEPCVPARPGMPVPVTDVRALFLD